MSRIEHVPVFEDVGFYNWHTARLLHEFAEGRKVLRRAKWQVAEDTSLPRSLSCDFAMEYEGRFNAYGRLDAGSYTLEIAQGQLVLYVAAEDWAHANSVVAYFRGLFPTEEHPEGQSVSVQLWVLTPRGPQRLSRKIDVPVWEEISANYTSATREKVSELMTARPKGGQILLWHGAPGTGKTFALRALAWEWRKWCSIHYVVDPEVLFGSEPSYLVQLLLDNDSGYVDLGEEEEANAKWRLLVMEDTGELLMPDAKQNVGQALSRLLNVTDGILGQGLRLMILITTNEEVNKLHPAVSRPGRTAARVSFEELSPHESHEWLKTRGLEDPPHRSMTVADLYAQIEDRIPQEASPQIGFAPLSPDPVRSRG